MWGSREIDHMNEDRNAYVYEYRGWTEPLIWFTNFAFWLVVGACSVSLCGRDCHYCPVYYLCQSQDKEGDDSKFLAWIKAKCKERHESIDIKFKSKIH